MIEAASAFVPATIAAEPAALSVSPPSDPAGRMEIILRDGVRVIVAADVDVAALGRVMKVLSRQ